MAKVRVPVIGTVGKSVSFDPNATVGSQLGTDFRLPDGSIATVASLRRLLGIGTSGDDDGNGILHSELEGLQVGDDHPQYTMWAARETIKATWTFKKPINITRTEIADEIWSFVNWFDESGTNAPPIRMAHDDFGSFHMVTNANYAGTDNDFNRIDTSKPSFMISMNQQFEAIVFHVAQAGTGVLDWDTNNAALFMSTDGALQVRANGLEAAPSIRLGAATAAAMGLYRDGNTMRFSTQATERMNVSSVSFDCNVPIRASNGSAASPTFTWWSSGNNNTGLYLAGTDQIGVTINGTNRWTISATELTSTILFHGPAGSNTAPVYSTAGDTNSGDYSGGADIWNTATGGVLRLSISTTAITATLPMLSTAGSASAPGRAYTGDTDSGEFQVTDNTLGWTTAGTERFRIGPNGEWGLSGANYGAAGQVLTSNGSSAAPTWEDASGGGGGALVYVNTTVPAGNTIANTASETAFASSYDIPANALAVGSVIRVALRGTYGTDGAAAPTLRARLKLDSTTTLDTGVLTTVTGTTNGGWSTEGLFVVTAIGASGAVEVQGVAQFSTTSGAALLANPKNTATITVDTTQALTVSATAEWGTADTDNTITLREMAIWIDSAAVAPEAAAPATATYLTEDDESGALPNSRQLLAGTNVTFDDSVANERTINVAAATVDYGTTYEFVEDFVSNVMIGSNGAAWHVVSSGTNANGGNDNVSAEGNHPGVVSQETGTTTTGSGNMLYAFNASSTRANGLILDSDDSVYEVVFKTSTVPDGTQTYTWRAGFMDEVSGAPTNGVVLELYNDAGTAKWRLTAYAAGVATSSAGFTGPANNTWYYAKVTARTGNSELFINGVSIVTLTSGLPSAGFKFGQQIIKSAGTTNRTVLLDFVRVSKTFTTPRF